MHLDIPGLIATFGYVGLAVIVFAESGFLLGFFLPGDSLLFTAGILASQGHLDVRVLVPLLFAAAVGGDSFGYAFGKRIGPRLFAKPDARLFKQTYVERTRGFYARHGSKTIVLARFVPIVRTFAPILAGVGGMRYATFLRFNLVGGLIWAVGVTLMGYGLGEVVPDIDKYVIPGVLVIIVLSILPGIREIVRERKKATEPG